MHGIDVETTALRPAEGDLRLVQISDGKKARVYDAFKQDASVIAMVINLYDELVAHNAVFEREWLNAALDVDRPDLHDTMIMSQVYYTGTRAAMGRGFSHSLANVVKRELKLELAKDEQQSDWGALALTREQLEYAARDAAILPKLAQTLMHEIERAGLKRVYELERRVSHAVHAMERRGVAIHTDLLDAMTEEATERAERLKAELTEEWGINRGSSKQLIEHFGLEERKDWPRTEGGKPSTNQEAMKGLLAEEESVAKWLEWKEVEKIRSTYGESLRKRLTPEGRIHVRFHPFGTATGRFSSSSPNLQNMWRAPAGADSPVLAACLRAKLNFSKLLGVREAPEACWPGYPREVNGHQARALSDGMQIRAYLFYAAGRLWRVGALKLSVSAHVLLGD